MNKFLENIRYFFTAHPPLPAGIYNFQTPPEVENQYRLHLRLEPNGEGILIVNARTVLHLNQTAAEYIYHLVKGTGEDQAVEEISGRYRVSSATVHEGSRARASSSAGTPGQAAPGGPSRHSSCR